MTWTVKDVRRALATLNLDNCNGKYDSYERPGAEVGHCRYAEPLASEHADPEAPRMPDCIVGHVVYVLGGQDALRVIADNGEGVGSANGALLDADFGFDEVAEECLAAMQGYADQGMTWADAVNEASLDVEVTL